MRDSALVRCEQTSRVLSLTPGCEVGHRLEPDAGVRSRDHYHLSVQSRLTVTHRTIQPSPVGKTKWVDQILNFCLEAQHKQTRSTALTAHTHPQKICNCDRRYREAPRLKTWPLGLEGSVESQQVLSTHLTKYATRATTPTVNTFFDVPIATSVRLQEIL